MTTHTLTKAELEYYAKARPRTTYVPGYFKDGDLRLTPHYVAHLGKKPVGFYEKGCGLSYIAECGGYRCRQDALKAAKLFQAKMKEWLETGNYVDAA